MDTQLEKSSQELDYLHQTLEALSAELTPQFENDPLKGEGKELEGKISVLTDENKRLSSRIDERDQTIADLQKANESMEKIFRLQKAIAGIVMVVFSAGLSYA